MKMYSIMMKADFSAICRNGIDSMRVCGIIAEYDPFHKGHEWQLKEAREKSKADFVLCVMSMSFTQRGMPALLCPHDRAEMALRCGADAVLGVPYAFSVCDAEKFALGGIEILRKTNCVNALSFGIETDGLSILEPTAQLLEHPTKEFNILLRQYMMKGLSYPSAQGKTLAECLNADEQFFTLPNTSLAICYLRACLKTNAGFEFFPVERRGEYHDKTLKSDSLSLPSASAVRTAFANENLDAVKDSMPKAAYRVLERSKQNNTLQQYAPLDTLLRWRLRNDNFSQLPDLSEGIENRFRDASNASTRNEMVLSIKTKRYTYARINRLLSHILTETRACDIPALPNYAYVLGFKRSASDLMHEIGKGELKLYHRLPSGDLSPMQKLDQRADDLWHLGANQSFGALHRARPVIID